MEFVFGSFSCFNIEIAYSNFTFCGAWTPSFFTFSWKLSQIQENEHTPGKERQFQTCICTIYYANWLGVDRQTVGQWCGENIRWKTSTRRTDWGEIDVQRVAGRCTCRYRIPCANLIIYPVCSTWTLQATSKEKTTYEKQNTGTDPSTTLVKPQSRQYIGESKIFQTGRGA